MAQLKYDECGLSRVPVLMGSRGLLPVRTRVHHALILPYCKLSLRRWVTLQYSIYHDARSFVLMRVSALDMALVTQRSL